MGGPASSELDDAFAVVRDDILAEFEEKRKQVLAQVRLTGNSGGYLPALTEWGSDRVRTMVFALTDAYVETFTLHGVPLDERAEKDLNPDGPTRREVRRYAEVS